MNAAASPHSCQEAARGSISSRVRHIPELDGLRGVMAFWVVLIHLMLTCGWTAANLPRGLRALAHGSYPVDVFIILSGFVIFKLLRDSHEHYGVFVLRRFFRLFPLFAACLGIALIEHPLLSDIHAANAFFDPATAANTQANWASETQFFWKHLAAHLTMLHGAIPNRWLEAAPVTLLAPAWSISLEWQFYLVAPLVFMLIARFRETGWLLFSGAIMICTFGLAPLIESGFALPSCLPLRAGLFAVGIVSFYAIERIGEHPHGMAWGGIFLAIASLALVYSLLLPLGIWFATLAAVTGEGRLTGAFRNLLVSRPLQWLGRHSYSIYLGHFCCIWPAWWMYMRLAGMESKWSMLFWIAPASIVSTLLLSVPLYRYIEKPGIDLGRKLAARIQRGI